MRSFEHLTVYFVRVNQFQEWTLDSHSCQVRMLNVVVVY